MKDLHDLFAPQANVKSLPDLYDPYDNLPATLKQAARKALRLKEEILKHAYEEIAHPYKNGVCRFPLMLKQFEYIGPSAGDYLKPLDQKTFNFSLELMRRQSDGIQEVVIPFSLSEMSALYMAYPSNHEIRREVRAAFRPFKQEIEHNAAFTREVLADEALGESQSCLNRIAGMVRRGGGLGRDL